jgi:hypothetical protein
MNQTDQLERLRKRELRIERRNKILERNERRYSVKERAERIALRKKNIEEILQADKKKSGKSDKRPGPEKFLALYSYIPSTTYDSRWQIPPSWKPHSFSENKQHLEFLRKFVYPYPLPDILLWATHSPEFTVDEKGKKTDTPDLAYIRFAKKWIRDIVSGQSFFKLNKEHFTKAEAHFFLNSKIPYTDAGSVLVLYFYAKCRARAMNHKMSLLVAEVFTAKFNSQSGNSLVESFLDLIGRTPQYNFERGMLGDLCDFVLTKITENKQLRGRPGAFSFSGRTITSVIALTNEWHEHLRREEEARRAQREAHRRQRQQDQKNEAPHDFSKWKGLGLMQFRHQTDEYIWTVTELRTAQDLVNEGRKMKNCVSSYDYNCVVGDSALFTIDRICPLRGAIEKVATLEVNKSKRTLIQGKGKCNTTLTPRAMSIVTRWASENGIKVRLLV